jgi:hypothetical protein
MQRASLSLALILVAASSFLGCGEEAAPAGKGPTTEPVRGKVVFTKGGTVKSLYDKQARIEFESVEQPGVLAAGAIQEDGTFEVATNTSEGGSLGAVPGTHRVRIDIEENAQKLVAPKFLDFAKSGIKVQVPTTGEVVVEVWK